MNTPYKGNFYITQTQHANHRGLDMSALRVGDLSIYPCVQGVVIHAGWENISNKSQGFGLYVAIKSADGNVWYYGHLSQVCVKSGQYVTQLDKIGVEGSTGSSTGSHLHLECRTSFSYSGKSLNLSQLTGIPNKLGDVVIGSTAPVLQAPGVKESVKELQQILNAKGNNLVVDGIYGPATASVLKKFTIEINDRGELTRWTQKTLNSIGFNCGFVDGIAEPPTMRGILNFQIANKLGSAQKNGYTYLGGTDWDVLISLTS